MESNNLRSLEGISLDDLVLYDVDVMYMVTYFQPKQTLLVNLTSLSFKGCQFRSNCVSAHYLGDMPKLDLSLIFSLTNLSRLTLSHSNFLQVITDSNLEKFCSALRDHHPLEYLGFAYI
jgi:hypothetical protein